MDEADEEHLKSLYERRKVLRRRIDIDEEQVAKGVPSTHIRFDLEEAKGALSKTEEEIDDLERKRRYSINSASHFGNIGALQYQQAIELISEIQELENSESPDQYRIEELRTYAMSSLKLAIRNGYISAEIFFLLGKIYDIRGNVNEAFEYYTASILSNEKNWAAYEARIALCQILLELKDAQAKLIQLCLDKDKRMLYSISNDRRKEPP